MYKRSVVELTIEYQGSIASGTGFFVDREHIVTSLHLVELQDKISFSGVRCFIVGIDRSSDIAVLKSSISSNSFLKWGKSRNSSPGDKIFKISNELGLGITEARGLIRNPRFIFPRLPELISCDLSSNYGDSGAPILNVKGEVIGILISTVLEGYSGSYTVSSGYTLAISQYTIEDTIRDIIGMNHMSSSSVYIRYTLPFPVRYVNLETAPEGLLRLGGILSGEDVITHIEGVEIGVYSGQTSIVTSMKDIHSSDEVVAIEYLKGSDSYTIRYTGYIIPVRDLRTPNLRSLTTPRSILPTLISNVSSLGSIFEGLKNTVQTLSKVNITLPKISTRVI